MTLISQKQSVALYVYYKYFVFNIQIMNYSWKKQIVFLLTVAVKNQ